MIPCPSCSRTWASEQTLAVHLMDEHKIPTVDAVERARQCVRDVNRQYKRMGKRALRWRYRPTEEEWS